MSDDESAFEDPADSLEEPDENLPNEQNSARVKTGGGDETKIHDDRTPVAKTPEELVKVVQEKKASECSIHNPNGQADVCSPPSLIQAMAKFVEAKGDLKSRPEMGDQSGGLKSRPEMGDQSGGLKSGPEMGDQSGGLKSGPETGKSSEGLKSGPETGKSSEELKSGPETGKSSEGLKSGPETGKSSEGLKEGAVEGKTSRKKFQDAVNKVITSRKVVDAAKELLNCDSESCVLQSSEFRQFAQQAGFQQSLDAIIQEFFKPAGPAKNFGLLNNLHIDNVLTQLEKKFPTFLHIPFQMRDFEKQKTALATINLADEFKKGKRFFGVVLNTDYTVGPGIHWFCLFGEYQPEQKKVIIEYFNSSGEPPLPEVQAWIHKTENLLKFQMKVDVVIKYSTGIRLQSDNHSCGVYCLMYIWLRLEGKEFKWFNTSNVGDKLMHNARQALFIPG